MKIWLKRVLISLVVVLIAAVIGVAIFLLTFDPNAYKSKLEQLVYERYQRTLSIRGDLELSLFPRIGFAVQDVSLSDRDSRQPFASIGSARFAVAIWPLLFNRLVVDHVAITGFKAWLVRDSDGQFNFRDLVQRQLVGDAGAASPPRFGARTAPDGSGALPSDWQPLAARAWTDAVMAAMPAAVAAPATDKTDLQIDIAGLELKDGEIHLIDHKTGSRGRLTELDVNTGRMTFDQAFDVAMKGRLLGDRPQADAGVEGQALVRIDPLQGLWSAQRLNLQVRGDLGHTVARQASLKGDLAYNEYSRMLNIGGLELQVQGEQTGKRPLKNLDARVAIPQLRLDRSRAELKVSRLAFRARARDGDADVDIALDAPSVAISPENAQGEPVSASLKRSGSDGVVGLSLNLEGLGGNAFDVLFKEVRADTVYQKDKRVMRVEMSSPGTWSPFQRRGSLSAMKGDVRIEDARLPEGSFQFPFIGSLQADLHKDTLSSDINAVLNGSKVDFRLAASQLEQPRVAFDLTADRLDLNALLPGSSSPDEDGKAEDGDARKADEGAEGRSGAPSAAASTQLDWRFLRAATVQGTIAVDEFRTGELELEGLRTGLTVEDGVLTLPDLHADAYGGRLESRISLDAEHRVAVDLAVHNADMGPLTRAALGRPRVTGQGDIRAIVQSRGDTGAALLAQADGDVRLNVRDGAWVGLDLGRTIDEAADVIRNLFSGQRPDVVTRLDPARQTRFSSLDAEIALTTGQGTLTAFELTGPDVVVQAATPATIDLVNQQLDVVLAVKARPKASDDSEDDAGRHDARALLEAITVPIRLSGPFGSPTYVVQWQDIRDLVVKDALQQDLLQAITDSAGDVADYFSGQAPAEQPGGKSDALKSIGDALRGLLKP